MAADRLIRAATWAAVLFVAACAAVVSYEHIYDLGRAHGQTGAAGRLLPLSVDGTIVAAGLMLLHEARAGHEPLLLARVMLWSGIGATLAANLAYGWPYGVLGALGSAWPAYAFLGITEAVMMLVRRMSPAGDEIRTVRSDLPAGSTDGPAHDRQPVPMIVTDAGTAAMQALRATTAAGNPYSVNQLSSKFHLSRQAATKIRDLVRAEANGTTSETAKDQEDQ